MALSTTHLPRLAARWATRLALLATVSIAIPMASQPVLAGSPRVTLTASVRLIGTAKPYRLEMMVDPVGIPVNLELDLVRIAATGNKPKEQHSYQVSGPQMTCTPSLGHCTITDASTMGSFGQVTMAFRQSAAATHVDDLCPDSSVQGHITYRKGTLTGTLRLRTGSAYFGTIRNGGGGVHTAAAIPARIESYSGDGHMCPFSPSCEAGVRMDHLDFTSDEFAFATRSSSDPRAHLQIGYQDAAGTDTVTVQHQIIGSVPKPLFRITSNNPKELQQVKADFGGLAPFVSGIATFTGTDDPEFSEPCNEVTRPGIISGPITVFFDGWGTYHPADGAAIVIWDSGS